MGQMAWGDVGYGSGPYPSDLTDAQWEELAPLLPPHGEAIPGCVSGQRHPVRCAAGFPGV